MTALKIAVVIFLCLFLLGRLRVGGGAGLHTSLPVPQERDELRFTGTLRTGGQPAVRTVLPIPEA